METCTNALTRPDGGRLQTLATQHPLQIVHIVSSLLVGGLEQFVVRLTHAQRKQGHDVTILTLHDGPLRAEAEKLSLPVLCMEGKGKAARVFASASALARLRPDVIHAHNPPTLPYAMLGKRLTGAKVALTYHGRGTGKIHEPDSDEWHQIDAIVAVSEETARQMRRPAMGNRLSVIHNGVTLSEMPVTRATARRALDLDDGPVGVMVARIDGRKGHDTLLHALSHLQEQRLFVTALIVGDGEKRAEYEQLAQSLGVAKQVRFMGLRTDVPLLLTAADFFLLPSITEGLPLSLLEAMAYRLPVIATPVGGIPEVVRAEETGILVPPENPASLASAMARLIYDPGLQQALGEAGYYRAANAFSFDVMVAKYHALYTKLCGEAARS